MLESIFTKVILGIAAGFIVGFLINILFKFLVLLVGIYGGSLAYLDYKNLITIHWERIKEVLLSIDLPLSSITNLAASLSVIVVAFFFGFYIGTQIDVELFAGVTTDTD